MTYLLAFLSIIFFIILAVVIIGIVKFVSKKSISDSDSERRIRELEEENRILKSNRDI
jgi:large-conductance mechanosensitive channel